MLGVCTYSDADQRSSPQDGVKQDGQVCQIGRHSRDLLFCREDSSWHMDDMAIELAQDIGRRITVITEDIRET